MSPRSDLTLAWCGHDAATYAVSHWHYSRCMPAGKMASIGVWERGAFIGCVVFSWGANRNMAKAFQLKMTECAELVRVALTTHTAPVSRVVAIALRMVQRQSPGLRLIVSYADPAQQHVGAIYQAGNWIYTGVTGKGRGLKLGRQLLHKRAYTGRTFNGPRMPIPAGAVFVSLPGKHRYLMPLDEAMRTQVRPLAQPYPKRDRSAESARQAPPAGDGVNPIRSLHSSG